MAVTGVVTSLPFSHKVIAGDANSDPFLFLSGPSIDIKGENLHVEVKPDGGLFIGIPIGSNDSFEQPIEVILRYAILAAIGPDH